MGHWEDLMDLDSDPYMTPNSTMTHTSPISETSWSDVQLVSNDIATPSMTGGLGSAPTAATAEKKERTSNAESEPMKVVAEAAQDAPTSNAEVPENEVDNDDVESEPEIVAADGGPRKPKLSERRKAQNSKFSYWSVHPTIKSPNCR